MHPSSLQFLTIVTLLASQIYCRCAFEVGPDNVPVKVDKEPHIIENM